MSYSVKEIFYTLQGEGRNSGRPAVFCRFSGCNLWNGREEDRKNALCNFCDTDFIGTDGIGGGVFPNAEKLISQLETTWDEATKCQQNYRFVVFTGGEPLLQLDDEVIAKAKSVGFEVAIETNGTLPALPGIDWICVSPKTLESLKQNSGDELKLIYPQAIQPEEVENLDFDYFYLSPMMVSNPNQQRINIINAIDYCKRNPKWQLTMQHHKFWDIP